VKLLLFLLAVLSIALFASMAIRAVSRQRHEEGAWPFTAQQPLSQVEQDFYFRLVQTLPDQIVLAQVPLSRFLRIRKGQPWREWRDRIGEKTIDYLICDRDFAIVAAVALDDRPHDGARRLEADITKNRALAAARIPLVRWRAIALPDAATIRAVVDEIRRERYGDVGLVTPVRDEPSLSKSRIAASNDPTMFHEETQQ
jgi:Protein of unknown function (DUF2726)